MPATQAQAIGPLDRTLYIVNRALRRLSGGRARLVKYQFWVQQVPDTALLPARPGGTIAIRELGPHDPEVSQIPRPTQVVAERFAQGGRCLGAFQGQRLLAFIWFSLGSYNEDEVRVTYSPRPAGLAAWDYDLFVAPEARGGLLFARLWDAAYAAMRSAGCRWTMSRISSFNPTSLASHARLGGQAVGWGLFLRFGGWQLMVSSIAPHAHFSVGPDARPELTITAGQ